MNATQLLKYCMYYAIVSRIAETDPAILAKMPRFTDLAARLPEMLKEISQHSQTQMTNLKGFTIDKQKTRTELIMQLLDLVNRVKAYAASKNRKGLLEAVGLTFTDLNRKRDLALVDFAQFFENEVTPLLDDLAPYGVTASAMTRVSSLRAKFMAAIPKTRNERGNRRFATVALVTLFKEVDEVVAQLKLLAGMLRYEETFFYNLFMRTCRQGTYGHRPFMLMGAVQGEDDEVLEQVLVRLPELKRETHSTEKGSFRFKHLPSGIYAIEFSRPGYEPHREIVALTKGLRTTVMVKMKAKVA